VSQLSLLLVDDHEVVREGLRFLLQRHPQFSVVAEAATVQEAVEAAKQFHPNVAVLDIRLPGRSGIEACREIKGILPNCRVVMLTSYADEDLLMEAISAGASGYILKQIGSDALVQALEAVGRGESLLDPSLVPVVFRKLREVAQKGHDAAFAGLTEQELHILLFLCEGMTNRAIAQSLSLSEKTVRNYVSSILSKLHLANRAEAAAYAERHHLRAWIEREAMGNGQ